ncbi:MAG TPA: endonuclease/exonuclease/phosphatase family protein [Chryseosolibacter sp.]
MKTFLFIVGYLFVLFSLIPLVRSDNWIFRIFEYPRFQKLIITLTVFLSFLWLGDFSKTHDLVFASILGCNVFYLCYQVFPYTVMARGQMKRTKVQASERTVSLLICNVFQDNKNVEALLDQVQQYDPDMVLLVEVNSYWDTKLRALHGAYHHRVLSPLENTYGMSLYSKLELVDPSVKYLVERGIPSIHTKVKLSNGEVIQLFGLHPEPPVPNENPRSTERDAEILLIAKKAEKLKMPVIVAGDLNDVAWSYTTELFLKVSGLLDPRRGRGFYNTFHVKYPLMRWPLDHVFCSKHFRLVELKRLPDMGSDHFPMFISLQLSREAAVDQEKEKLDKEPGAERVAKEKIRKVA